MQNYGFLIEKSLPNFPTTAPHHPRSGWGARILRKVCRISDRLLFQESFVVLRMGFSSAMTFVRCQAFFQSDPMSDQINELKKMIYEIKKKSPWNSEPMD